MTSDRAEHGSSSWYCGTQKNSFGRREQATSTSGRGVYREKPASSQRASGCKGQGFRPVVNQTICNHNGNFFSACGGSGSCLNLLTCALWVPEPSASPLLCMRAGLAQALCWREIGRAHV